MEAEEVSYKLEKHRVRWRGRGRLQQQRQRVAKVPEGDSVADTLRATSRPVVVRGGIDRLVVTVGDGDSPTTQLSR